MEFKAYKLSFYLNARHSMDSKNEDIHSHTFHLCLYLDDLSRKSFINFDEISECVNGYLQPFSGHYLNEIAPFDRLIPTIENLGAVFYEDLKTILIEHGYDLIQIDIHENPLRVYSVSDRLYLGSKHAE